MSTPSKHRGAIETFELLEARVQTLAEQLVLARQEIRGLKQQNCKLRAENKALQTKQDAASIKLEAMLERYELRALSLKEIDNRKSRKHEPGQGQNS